MKTNTLTGADLNRAVAMTLGLRVRFGSPSPIVGMHRADCWLIAPIREHFAGPQHGWQRLPDYAGDISVAWPIIKEHKIELRWIITNAEGGGYWQAANLLKDIYGYRHQDPQIAALRTFVASVYGDDIELEQP